MRENTESPRMKILINLGSLLLCEALQGLLEKDPMIFTMVAHHKELSYDFEPDKLLVDAAALEQLLPTQWPDAKLILVDTGLAEHQIIRLFTTHRIHGVISTETGTELFHKALQTIHADEIWIDNQKLKALLQNLPPEENSTGREYFSRREREIVILIADGCRNREIATRLNVSEQTVKSHVSHIFRKAKVTSRTQLGPLASKFRT